MDCVESVFGAKRQNSPNDLDAKFKLQETSYNWFLKDQEQTIHDLTVHKTSNKAWEWNNNDKNEQNDLLRKETEKIRFFETLLTCGWLPDVSFDSTQ